MRREVIGMSERGSGQQTDSARHERLMKAAEVPAVTPESTPENAGDKSGGEQNNGTVPA